MWTNKILIYPLILFLFGCLDEKSSSDKTNAEKDPKPVPTSSPVTSQNENKKQEETQSVTNCEFYPDFYKQPDWSLYFDRYSSLQQDGMKKSLETFWVRSANKRFVFSSFDNQVTWPDSSEVTWVDKITKIPSQMIEGCTYPSIRRYELKNSKFIYVIEEWRTKHFYQPKHVLFVEKNKTSLWQDEFSGGRSKNLPLFRYIMSDVDQKVFLRHRYGAFYMDVKETAILKEIIDVQLMITNRMNAIIGNLAVKFKEGNLQVFLGPIEVFKVWDKQSYIYVVEFGAEAPQFQGDVDGVLHRKAKGNFDREKSRIRIFFLDSKINETIPFEGEYLEAGVFSKYIHFQGQRSARVEIFE